MNDKKNLDRLFQEKFKDFEVEPNEQVWKNIELALKGKEKKRRVIPFWYKLSGVAAALVIGGFIANSVLSSDEEIPQNTIVLDQNQANPIDASNGVATETNSKDNLEKERSLEKDPSETNKSSIISSEEKTNENSENAVVSSDKKSSKSNTKRALQPDLPNAVASQTDENSKTKSLKKSETTVGSQNAVASNTKKSDKNRKPKSASDTKSVKEIETAIANSSVKQTNGENQSETTGNTIKNQEQSIANNQNEQKNTIQNSTNPYAVKSANTVADNVDVKKLDSAAVATVEPNALEELLKKNEKEKNVIAEAKLNRWQITPQVAPIYFGSASNGSPIDAQFEGNEKTYDRNMSYGVAVHYAVSKKLNVRAGVNKLTLGYDTRDVSFSAGLAGRSFQNVSAPSNAPAIHVVSASAADGLLPFETTLQGIKTGSISQTMGYIEVPMELSYKLIDTKFGVNLIGGVSTLFLDENQISISSGDVNSSLGKANNLNDVHFSSNLGIGFRYSFWKSFDLNFEPTLKYQFNTFSKNSGDFKPYFIGLYTGVSFKF